MKFVVWGENVELSLVFHHADQAVNLMVTRCVSEEMSTQNAGDSIPR